MTYPNSDVSTVDMDVGTDSPATARSSLLDLAQKFNLLRNHISSFMQGLLTSATAAAARSTLSAASTGANNDITSLTAVTDLTGISRVTHASRVDVASAATVSLTGSPDDIRITGTTTITGFTAVAGRVVRVTFAGSLTLTNNANIVTQTGANLVTRAGDTCILRATAANTVEILFYTQALCLYSDVSVATTSGTAFDFTSIPSGVKRMELVFNAISTNGSSYAIVQLGSGSITTTGYSSGGNQAGGTNVVTGLATTVGLLTGAGGGAANIFYGSMTLENVGGNTWVYSASGGFSNVGYGTSCGGGITLAGVLDRLRLTTINGTDSFDSGLVLLRILE